jgi:hypothetical protein
MDNLIKFLQRYRWAIGIAFSLALLIICLFGFFPYRVFMGDDLLGIVSSQTGGWASSFAKAFTDTGGNKYRPVAASIFHLESILFGNNFSSYMYLNMFIEFLNACLVCYICYRLSRKQPYVAFAGGVMFVISRFAYYNVLQAFGGPLEGMALLFFLLLVYTMLNTYESKKPIPLAWPLLLYFLVIFTHERYVVVGGFLVAAILLAPINFKLRWHRFVLAAIPLMIFLFNYYLKTATFHIRFFEGTGGHPLTFNWQQIIKFMCAGLANMVGFNAGPSYLSGLNIFQAGITGFILGGVLSSFIIVLIVLYIKYQRRNKKITRVAVRDIFLLLVLFVLLLASASVTIRQEYRWLYAPYTVVIFGIAYLSARISPVKLLRYLLITCILLSAIVVDTYYHNYLGNIYFVYSMKIAYSAKCNIIDKYGSNLSQNSIFLVGDRGSIKTWVFQDSNFFKFYTGDPEINIQYIENIKDINNYQIDINNALVFSSDPNGNIIDITQEARAALVG